MAYEFEEPFVLDTTKYRSTFGSDTTPLSTAIAETVDWYRSGESTDTQVSMDEDANVFPLDITGREPGQRPWKFRPEGYLVVMLSDEDPRR